MFVQQCLKEFKREVLKLFLNSKSLHNNRIFRLRTCRLQWESVCSGLEVTRGSPIEYVKKIIMKLYVWKIS